MKTQCLLFGAFALFFISSCNKPKEHFNLEGADPFKSYYYFVCYYKPKIVSVENYNAASAYQLGFRTNDRAIMLEEPKMKDLFLQLAAYYGEKGEKLLVRGDCPFFSKPYGFVSFQVYTPEPEHENISQHYELYYTDYSTYIASNYEGIEPNNNKNPFRIPKEAYHNLAQLTPHDLKWLCDPCFLKRLPTAPKGDAILEVTIEGVGKITKTLQELKEP